MSKELKTFSKEKQALDELYDVAGNIKNLKEDYTILREALTEYEAIKNAEPTKAMECLESIWCDISTNYINEYVAIKQALQRLEAIDNANPSEALEELNILRHLEIGFDKNGNPITLNDMYGLSIIKDVLLKAQENARSEEILQKYYQEGITLDSVRALKKEMTELKEQVQEPKKYLKWEDLEFKEERQEIPVRMGETTYTLVLRKTDGGNKIAKLLSPKRNYMGEWGDMFYEEAKQFFNDLHLERVEE